MTEPVFQIRLRPTLADFMLARVEEEEMIANRRGGTPHQIHVWDLVGTYNDRCADCLGLPGTDRLRAECKTKRIIIGELQAANRVNRLIGAEGYFTGYRSACEIMLRAAAAAYKDHPDYQQEWNLTP